VVDDDPRFLRIRLVAARGCKPGRSPTPSTRMTRSPRRRTGDRMLRSSTSNCRASAAYGLCRELRNLFGSELPIIFVSGTRIDAIDRAAGMLIGGDDYLVKPVDPDELLARLGRLLERSQAWTKPSAVDLTDREIEVLQLIAEGLPPAEVAKRLVIAPKTVSSHMQRILAKLDVHTRAQAVAVAYESGLIRVLRTDPEVTAHLALDLA